MQEFELNLTRYLAKGLRPFPRNEIGAGDFLAECWNFMPSEAGLVPHERVYSLQRNDRYFNYLEIKDQLDVSWYWYPVFDGHILVGASIPSEPSTGLTAVAITPTPIPYWIDVTDENGVAWKLYPDSTTGETRATDVTALIGSGMSNLQWRGTTSEVWRLGFLASSTTRYAIRV